MKPQKSNDKEKILPERGKIISTKEWELDYYLSLQQQLQVWEDVEVLYSKFWKQLPLNLESYASQISNGNTK